MQTGHTIYLILYLSKYKVTLTVILRPSYPIPNGQI
jgi:hypothetical protein